MLYDSHFNKYFSFSHKNDPFLVHPSVKTQGMVAQGGGAAGLKRLRGGYQNNQKSMRTQKLVIPLHNQLMKIIRQSEVYLMEEAITDQIVKTTKEYIDYSEAAGVGGTTDQWITQGQPMGVKQTYDESIVDIQTD